MTTPWRNVAINATVALTVVASSVAAACAPPSARPVGLPGVVERVIDGDTVVMGDGQDVRLIGIDTPESGQPCYAEARAALSAMALDHTVALVPGARDDVDHYGRLLRYVDSAGGVDLGLEMIKQGWAVARYDSRDGYGRHPREASYVAADAVSPAQTCGTPSGAGWRRLLRQLRRRARRGQGAPLPRATRLRRPPRRGQRRGGVRVIQPHRRS